MYRTRGLEPLNGKSDLKENRARYTSFINSILLHLFQLSFPQVSSNPLISLSFFPLRNCFKSSLTFFLLNLLQDIVKKKNLLKHIKKTSFVSSVTSPQGNRTITIIGCVRYHPGKKSSLLEFAIFR